MPHFAMAIPMLDISFASISVSCFVEQVSQDTSCLFLVPKDASEEAVPVEAAVPVDMLEANIFARLKVVKFPANVNLQDVDIKEKLARNHDYVQANADSIQRVKHLLNELEAKK